MECNQRFAVLGGDARLTWVVRALRQRQLVARTFSVADCGDTYESMELTLLNADCVILPIPAFRGEYINTVSDRPLPLQVLLQYLHPGMHVFGGKLDARLPQLQASGAQVTDYGALETFAAANAVPTAEGAIQIAMEQTDHVLQDSHCLIVGYGRIGKVLAHKLRALGAHVTVSARKETDLAMIAAYGFQADTTCVYHLPLARYDVIFNTVPAEIFTGSQLAATKPDVLLLDLSSLPGGINQTLCSALDRRAITGWQLPGRVAPASAGRIICDTVLSQLLPC